MGRVAGLPDDRLPEVIVPDESVPPTRNDDALVARLRGAWQAALGEDRLRAIAPDHMGAEDFPYLSTNPDITSVYWIVGGTPAADFAREAAGGAAGAFAPFAVVQDRTGAFGARRRRVNRGGPDGIDGGTLGPGPAQL